MNDTVRQSETVKPFAPSMPLNLKEIPSEKAASEFKITVRKLEIPVRPRGVLAE